MDPLDVIKVVGVGMIAITLMVAIVSPVLGAVVDLSGERVTNQRTADAGETVALTGENITSVEVNQTLETALRLNSGSTSSGIEWSPDDNWTVATWTQIDDPANATGRQTVVSVDSRALVIYNGSSSEWVGYYVQDATGEVYEVRTSATDPANWTHVTLTRDGSSLSLATNATVQQTVTLDVGNTTQDNVTASQLDGSLEETRVFTRTLSGNERTDLVTSPSVALDDPAHVRLMYDGYATLGSSISSFPVFGDGATSSATVSSGVLRDGFGGQEVTESDYRLQNRQIQRTAGSVLLGQPMYASYDSTTFGPLSSLIDSLISIGVATFGLLVIGLLVIAVSYVSREFQSF
jgi:hypothetical protein